MRWLAASLLMSLACSPGPEMPHTLGGLDGSSDAAPDSREASRGPEGPFCGKLGGTCVKSGADCPIQITGDRICASSDEICCTGLGDR